jgi:drug/metabolite transporter (DMT)-like permease
MVFTVLYVGMSAMQIELNKWLIGAGGNFPLPLALSVMHQMMTWLLSWLLYLACPCWFPGVQSSPLSIWLWFIPIGAFAAGSLVLSHVAYAYCSMPFIQMLMVGNVMLTFIASASLGLERFSRAGFIMITIIFAGGLIAATGDLRFSILGLFLQITSQFCEVSKILCQNLLMWGKNHGLILPRLDPLSVVFFLAPVTFVFLGALMLWAVLSGHKEGDVILIWTHGTAVWHMISASSALAFGLNVVIAFMIFTVSATGLVLAGIAKDISITLASIFFLHEVVTRKQLVGFVLAFIGIMHYCMLKIHSDCFEEEDQIFSGFKRMYGRLYHGFDASEAERKKLLSERNP